MFGRSEGRGWPVGVAAAVVAVVAVGVDAGAETAPIQGMNSANEGVVR